MSVLPQTLIAEDTVIAEDIVRGRSPNEPRSIRAVIISNIGRKVPVKHPTFHRPRQSVVL